MHQKGWEQPGTLQKATISHPETSYHFHIGHFSQPSNLIKCPFSKWKTCKYPKLHNSFYLQKIFLGEGGKGSTENSKLGERWELEITFGIVLLLISIDITFNSTNSLQRFLFNAKEKDLVSTHLRNAAQGYPWILSQGRQCFQNFVKPASSQDIFLVVPS